MENLKKILGNAIATGLITALATLSMIPLDEVSLSIVYAACLGGAVAAVKEYLKEARDNSNKKKRIKNGRPLLIEYLTIF